MAVLWVNCRFFNSVFSLCYYLAYLSWGQTCTLVLIMSSYRSFQAKYLIEFINYSLRNCSRVHSAISFSSVVHFFSILGYCLWPHKSHRGPARRGGEWGGGSHVARLNFKTSRVGVYKCLSLIVGFAVTVEIWPREVFSCRDFILRTVATFWAMSLVGIYPGRAST